MKDKKRRLDIFSIYDHTGIKTHLENMAAKGWLLESMSAFGWVYRRIEPRKLHFAVTYYPKADDFDPEPCDAQKTFHDFCEHSGWIFATGFKKLQVFYNERENPIPIETDPILEVRTIHKAMKMSLLPDCCILLIFCFIQLGSFYKKLMEQPIETLSGTVSLIIVFDLAVLAIVYVVEVIGYIMWYKGAGTAASQGEFLPTSSHRKMKYAALVLIIISTIYYIVSASLHARGFMIVASIVGVLIFAAAMFVVGGIKSGLKSMNIKASINKVVTSIACAAIIGFIVPIIIIVNLVAVIVGTASNGEDYEKEKHPYAESYEYEGVTLTAYHDRLPFTVGDLTGNDDDNYSKRWDAQESLLICRYTANQNVRRDSAEDMPSLNYTITKVKIPATYDLCFNQLYNDYDLCFTEFHNGYDDKNLREGGKRRLVEIDTEPWGANAAYQVYTGDEAKDAYLICWDACIVGIDAGRQLTREQMGIIAEKLKGI